MNTLLFIPLVIFANLAVLAFSKPTHDPPQPPCSRNQTYSSCGPCIPYCGEGDYICPNRCYEGCFCKSGYVYNHHHVDWRRGCLLPEDCPPHYPAPLRWS